VYTYSASGLSYKFHPKAFVLEKKVPGGEGDKKNSQKVFQEFNDAQDGDIIITIEHW